eukprot:scaffold61668_cov44-Cyclotella_meneghiniana.AAC.1
MQQLATIIPPTLVRWMAMAKRVGRLEGDITIASSMLCINTGEEQFTSRAYKSPLDVPPLTEPGITCGCCKRGGNSNNTYQVVNTPRPSTLGMIAARGAEQKRVAPSHTPSTYLRYCVIATLNNCPPYPNSGIVLSKACARPMQKEKTAGSCYRPL